VNVSRNPPQEHPIGADKSEYAMRPSFSGAWQMEKPKERSATDRVDRVKLAADSFNEIGRRRCTLFAGAIPAQ